MKNRTAADVAGIGKAHKYLGHFAKAKHLNRGHNTVEDGQDITPETLGADYTVKSTTKKAMPKMNTDESGKKMGLMALIMGGG